MGRQETTIFASLGKGRHCEGQAFFDKCLSTCNRMAASSYCHQHKKAAALEIKIAACHLNFGHEDKSAQQRFFLFCRWADVRNHFNFGIARNSNPANL